MNCHLYHYAMSIFVSSYLFLVWRLLCLIWAWLHLLFGGGAAICLEYHLPSFHFELMCLSVELRWISWKKHIAGSCAWIHLAAGFWLVNTVHWHSGWLLVSEELLQPFYLLLSSFSTSPLSLFPYASACHSSLVVFCYVSLISSFLCLVSLALDLCFVVTMKFVENVSDKTVLFLQVASYLHLSIQVPSFSSFLVMVLLYQIVLFHVASLLPNWSRYTYFFMNFSPFEPYVKVFKNLFWY